jgi:6-phosphogluconolactonase (cycloisomerase 2 family)
MIKTLRTIVLVALATALGGTAAHAGVRASLFSDSVFVMSNSEAGNSVVMLKRTLAGGLVNIGTFSTGGVGSGPGVISASDPLGSQDALKLSEDGRWLFAVNAASSQISTFRVLEDRLQLTSVVDSGGLFPNAIAVKRNVVYVLNALNDGNVAGFRLSRTGRLQPIPGSVRALNLGTPTVGNQPHILFSPGDIAFSPDGDWLVLADKNVGGIGSLITFKVDSDGVLAKTPVVTASPDQAPFGITFDRRGHLLVTEAVVGALSSYDINDDGTLEPISLSVLNGVNRAPLSTVSCWVDTTRNFALMVNTFSQDISTYRFNHRGEVSLVDASAATAGPFGENGLIDIAISGDERFANVLSGDTGVLRSFSINPVTGALKLTATLKLVEGNSGLAGIAAE